jgi:hypothetical protein
MKRRGELEQQKFRIMKMARTAIRAYYASLADDRINDFLPVLEEQLNALEEGVEYELDVKSILEGS